MASNGKKIALITGAHKGIGFETARQLGHQGITVVVSARDQQKADQAAGKLKSEGIDAHGVKLDTTDADDYQAVASFLNKESREARYPWSTTRELCSGLDSAATTPRRPAKRFFARPSIPTSSRVIALTQALLPLLSKSEAGRIVNLSSILGWLTLHSDPKSPIYGSKTFAYDASKTALNAYTVHLAHELRDTKIKVNSAHPGWVKTDMGTDAARWKSPRAPRRKSSWPRFQRAARPALIFTSADVPGNADRATRGRVFASWIQTKHAEHRSACASQRAQQALVALGMRAAARSKSPGDAARMPAIAR